LFDHAALNAACSIWPSADAFGMQGPGFVLQLIRMRLFRIDGKVYIQGSRLLTTPLAEEAEALTALQELGYLLKAS
jgi:hypothetical protein